MSHYETNRDSFVLFELAGTTYALRGTEVLKLEMIEHITPVPNASPELEGVVFSQGEVIPAISLRTRFGFPKTDYDIRSRLLIVQAGERKIGLIVDSAREFKNISADIISNPPESLVGTSGNYLIGIATIDDRLILILDLEALVNGQVTAAIEEGKLEIS
jgi:purine-binding chemotaxis protein CheW